MAFRELNSRPLAPKARIVPLDQMTFFIVTFYHYLYNVKVYSSQLHHYIVQKFYFYLKNVLTKGAFRIVPLDQMPFCLIYSFLKSMKMLASQIVPLQNEECKYVTDVIYMRISFDLKSNSILSSNSQVSCIFVSYRLQNPVRHSPSLHIQFHNNTIEYPRRGGALI